MTATQLAPVRGRRGAGFFVALFLFVLAYDYATPGCDDRTSHPVPRPVLGAVLTPGVVGPAVDR
jgi:hypothetical protein